MSQKITAELPVDEMGRVDLSQANDAEKAWRQEGFRDGYASARNYYEQRATDIQAVLTAWADPSQDRARTVIAQAWPDLAEALNTIQKESTRA